jgi:branched-chain amino acid transport system substrate-binding protein
VQRRYRAVLPVTAGLVLVLAACGESTGSTGSGGSSRSAALIALNIPTTTDAFLASELLHGAQLAVKEHNAKGLKIGGRSVTLSVKSYDDDGQPQTAAANVQSAIHDGAVAIIEDGIGAKSSAPVSAAAGVPEIDIGNGDVNLIDPQKTPSLYRLSIADDIAAQVLGSYMSDKSQSAAIIHDDSEGGRDAADQLSDALGTSQITAKPVVEIAANSGTINTQILQVSQAHPGAIAIEGGDTFIGRVTQALRAAGVKTPLYAGAFGEFPAVRALAGSAAEGLTFVSARLTSESDEESFPDFEKRLAQSGLGCTDAGVKTAAGQEVRQPDDYAMYAYDSVNVVVAALQKLGSVTPSRALLDDMVLVQVKSANGDSRGFNSQNREGIADDDIYLASIHDNAFQPVKDEQLSASLPAIDEVLADCQK